MESETASFGSAIAPASTFFSLASDLLSQVQTIVAQSPVYSFRVKIGDRLVKELKVNNVAPAAIVALVLLAVVVSSLSIEFQNDLTASSA